MIPYVAGPQLVHLHELAVIGELGDDFVNVIGSPGIRRHDIHEPRALPDERVAGLHDRREVMTVRRKQRNQVTDVVEARLLVVVHEVRNAGVLRVHLGTAELLRNHAGGAHVTAEDAPWMAPDPVTTPSLKGCPAPWSSDASDADRRKMSSSAKEPSSSRCSSRSWRSAYPCDAGASSPGHRPGSPAHGPAANDERDRLSSPRAACRTARDRRGWGRGPRPGTLATVRWARGLL